MRTVVKVGLVKLVVLSLLVVQQRVKAEPELPPQIPNSAGWINQLFKAGSSLTDVANPLNWVVYSAAGTYFYYQYMLKGSLKTALAARNVMVMQLRETNLAIENKKKLIQEVDLLIDDLKRQIEESEKAFQEIPSHYQKLNKHLGTKSKKRFGSISDYSQVEQWLKTERGQKFLKTEPGKEWLEKYESLKIQSTEALEEPLRRVITKVNEVIENPKADMIKPVNTSQLPPGNFTSENSVNYGRNQLPLGALSSHADKLKSECHQILSGLVAKKTKLTQDTNFFQFWSRKENISPVLKHGVITLGGAGATLWLYKLYKFDEKKREADLEAKLKGDSAFDLATTLRMERARKLMAPYYEAIRKAMLEKQDQIVEAIEKNLTDAEKQKIDVRNLVQARLKGDVFDLVVESVILKVAKTRLGDRTSVSELTSLINRVKNNPDVREGIFRSFHKDVVHECINTLWSEFTSGDLSNEINPETLRQLRQLSETMFLEMPKNNLQAGVKTNQ
ncbi:MAG: hypothetical protein ACKOA8_05000 [Deltaproteobacteria bacterium]